MAAGRHTLTHQHNTQGLRDKACNHGAKPFHGCRRFPTNSDQSHTHAIYIAARSDEGGQQTHDAITSMFVFMRAMKFWASTEMPMAAALAALLSCVFSATC
jgi:hypothetical protein